MSDSEQQSGISIPEYHSTYHDIYRTPENLSIENIPTAQCKNPIDACWTMCSSFEVGSIMPTPLDFSNARLSWLERKMEHGTLDKNDHSPLREGVMIAFWFVASLMGDKRESKPRKARNRSKWLWYRFLSWIPKNRTKLRVSCQSQF